MFLRLPQGAFALHPAGKARVQPDVEHVRLGVLLGFEHLDLVLSDQLADLAFRVVQVTEHAGTADAGFHARRQQADRDAVGAESALVGFAGIVIDEAGVVGASLDAVGAADAALAVDHDGAVGLLEGGADRAHRNAGRVGAVIAQPRQHVGAGVAVVVYFVGGNDGAEAVFRHGVFHDAADRARLAANALADVHDHGPARHMAGFVGCSASLASDGPGGNADAGLSGREQEIPAVTSHDDAPSYTQNRMQAD